MVVYQYDDGLRPVYKTCISQVEKNLPAHVSHILLDKADYAANCDDYRAVSNILRCRLACYVKDMVWLDSDVLIKKWIDFPAKMGKVYFATGNSGDPEPWAFYVNGQTDFFLDMYLKYEEEKPQNIWWFSEFLNNHRSRIELIPKGYFTHLMLSRAILAKNNFHNIGTTEYNIKRDAETNELKIELR